MKQAILIRMDLHMGKGKIASQAAHASVEAAFKGDQKQIKQWRDQGMKKVVLRVADEKELLSYKKKAAASGFIVALITDAGHTQVSPGEKTCLAIGPASDAKIDALVGGLKLL